MIYKNTWYAYQREAWDNIKRQLIIDNLKYTTVILPR